MRRGGKNSMKKETLFSFHFSVMMKEKTSMQWYLDSAHWAKILQIIIVQFKEA